MRPLAVLSLFAALAAVDATAAPMLFTDRATWEAAAGTIQNIDFEGIAPDGGLSNDLSATGLDLGGVHFQSYGNQSYLLVVDDTYPNFGCGYGMPPGSASCYSWGSGAVLHGSPFGYGDDLNPAGIAATFAGTTAVGTDLWTILPDQQVSGDEYRVIVTVDGTDYTYTIDTPAGGPPNRGFVGFVSDGSITAIKFEVLGNDGLGPYADLDNFAVAVPEPGSLILLGSGLLAAGVLSRRRRPNR